MYTFTHLHTFTPYVQLYVDSNIIITVNYSVDRAEILCAPKADAALPWYHYRNNWTVDWDFTI